MGEEISTVIRYEFEPQDIRMVKGLFMTDYIIDAYCTRFGKENIHVRECDPVHIRMEIKGEDREELEISIAEFAEELQEIIDLSGKSSFEIHKKTGYDNIHYSQTADTFSYEPDKFVKNDTNDDLDYMFQDDADDPEFIFEEDKCDPDPEDDDDEYDPDSEDEDDYEDDEDNDREITHEDYVHNMSDGDDYYAFSKRVTRIMDEIESLIGAESFKEVCRNLVKQCNMGYRDYLRSYFERCAICFSISGGDGLSKYIECLSKLLKATGIMNITSEEHSAEVKKNKSLAQMEESMTAAGYMHDIVSLDLAFKMDICDKEEFRTFIRNVSRNHPDRLPLFKIPYSEGLAKERMIDVLSSAFPLITIDIPPFSSEEYAQFALMVFDALGFTVEEEAMEELLQLIIQCRGKDHFYGFNSVKQLVQDIIFKKNLMEVKEKEDMSLVIREKDLLPMLERYDTDNTGKEELDDLIGIEEIKARIDEILVQLELAKDLPAAEKPCMHMIFTGAPGTGKTTVARILGKILKQKGLLSKGYFFERTGRDLVGRYIGETAPITNAACRDAYGSVLFIDEAYTLVRSGDDGKDFGKEALETLLTQMENHKQDFLVIMAGYSEEMKRMISYNPGLESRIPHEIKFRNYTREELAQIYMRLAHKKYDCSDDLEETVKKYFMSLSDELLSSENFANARYCRNLYERTVSKAAMRYQASTGERLSGYTKLVITAEDFENASTSDEFNQLQKKTQHFIGFV